MLSRSTYFAMQNARIAWFLGQYLVSNRLSRPADASSRRSASRRRPSPTLAELLQDIAALLRKDWQNIRDGVYRAPPPISDEAGRLLADALRYFRDLPAVTARRRRNGYDEVPRMAPGVAPLPDYYLRNFHYQTDGYLSDHSARLYDQQVEVLFIGSADAMRRQALPPIASFMRRRHGRGVHVDVACGTGRFLGSVMDNFPRLHAIGVDLSLPYLAEAARVLRPHPGISLMQGAAEALPLSDSSVDLLTCVYLLHEVPRDIRQGIAREFARVLRPGGRVVIVDSLQNGDRPAWDSLLAAFPKSFHEPFYADYAATDLKRLFGEGGLRPTADELAFLSKILVFDKPAAT